MTDRELLEAAANAIGEEVTFRPSGMCAFSSSGSIGPAWNPLTDDGDALRLANDLRLEVHPRWRFVEVHNGVEIIMEDCEGEPALRYAATRRAIVRAAGKRGRCK